MQLSIEAGFARFLESLAPDVGETLAATGHRRSLESCLEASLDMEDCFQSGSFGNGTSISRYSDVDLFAVIPAEHLHHNSTKALASVGEILRRRFPKTGVRVACPAIKVPFGTALSEVHDVVPAWESGMRTVEGYPVYFIADLKSGWMAASPPAHNSFVRNADEILAGQVKPLVRLIKAWKYYRNVNISSFYLELAIAQYSLEEPFIQYARDILGVFRRLNDSTLSPIRDPMGVSGYIVACATPPQTANARAAVSTALACAEKAVSAEDAGREKMAFSYWSRLYGSRFARLAYE